MKDKSSSTRLLQWRTTHPGDHGKPEKTHEDGHTEGELLPVGAQQLWPVVDKASHKCLSSSKLAVNAKGE